MEVFPLHNRCGQGRRRKEPMLAIQSGSLPLHNKSRDVQQISHSRPFSYCLQTLARLSPPFRLHQLKTRVPHLAPVKQKQATSVASSGTELRDTFSKFLNKTKYAFETNIKNVVTPSVVKVNLVPLCRSDSKDSLVSTPSLTSIKQIHFRTCLDKDLLLVASVGFGAAGDIAVGVWRLTTAAGCVKMVLPAPLVW